MKIFIDMDGTVAQFHNEPNYLERMTEKGFFLNLKPYAFAKEVDRLAVLTPDDVYILSACVESNYCRQEKLLWVKHYLPHIDPANIIFTKATDNKAKVIEPFIAENETAILIDDYGKNLGEWEKTAFNFVGVKAVNELNNKHHRHYDYTVKTTKQSNDIAETCKLIDKLYN